MNRKRKKSVQSINPPHVAGQVCKSMILTIYDILKTLSGEINVNTMTKQGTEFIITLPLQTYTL